ncbi:abasic site processing protein HMCES isoform X2 [Cloeon dipterum]
MSIKIECEEEDLEPVWIEPEAESLQYKANHNVTPTQSVPCLMMNEDRRTVITPMLWGFIPAGHKGTATNHGLTSFNARSEGLSASPLYKTAFKSGKRCAVLCTGYYEWKTIQGRKQPFFFHLPQEEDVLVDVNCKEEENEEFRERRVTPLAGIYHHWTNSKGEKIPNVTIITMGAGKWVSWCHHRMPVILDTPEKLNNWLDYDKINAGEAEKMFVEPNVINWYPVRKEFHTSKPELALKSIKLEECSLVPEFLSKWEGLESNVKIEPPEIGKYKSTLKRASSPLNDPSSPSKKQTTLTKWFTKKEPK